MTIPTAITDFVASPLGKLLADAIVAAVSGLLKVFARTGVSLEVLEAAKKDALQQVADIDAVELAAHARQWRIARGLE